MTAYLTHLTRDGERWDQLAQRYYGSVSMQSVLVAANRDQFPAALPHVLSAGRLLTVPIVERPATAPSSLPPWKR